MSTDPLRNTDVANPQGWNAYSYVLNNPINRVDPDGRLSFIATAGLGALENAAFQIAINKLEGKSWSDGVLKEMAVGAAIGATGVGLAKLADKGVDAYRAAKAAKAADDALDATKGATKALGRGSTADIGKGTALARNLREQLAIEQAMSNPGAGRELALRMTDARWPGSDGWVKMQQIVQSGGREGPINVHYLLNRVSGEIDDFKIVLQGAR